MGNVDRIEVVRGGQSALYGDYAVGGVINIITRRGREEPETEIAVTGGSHGFNDQTFSTTGEYKGTGYAGSIGHQSSDGYRDRSSYETWSGSLSLENDPREMNNIYNDPAALEVREKLKKQLLTLKEKVGDTDEDNPALMAVRETHWNQ